MNAGLLTDKIDVCSPTIITNEYGEQVTVWNIKQSTRCNIVHRSGARAIENSEVVYNYTKTFEERIYVAVNEYDRIRHDGKYYRILSIDRNKDFQKITIEGELVNE